MSRWETYSEARSKTMEKIESKLTLKDFRSSLPAAISKDKEYCTKVHKLLVRDLISKVSEFSDEVEDQVKLKTYLDQLDEMVKNTDTTTGSTAWRPSRNPLDNQVRQFSVNHYRRIFEMIIMVYINNMDGNLFIIGPTRPADYA